MQNIIKDFSGMLSCGETINDYSVKGMFDTDSAEAEIYLVTKQSQKYVLKYYYNCKPNNRIVKKVSELRHPYILSFFEYGEYKNHFYEIIEYLEGGALDSKTEDGKYVYLPFTEEQAIKFVKQVISGFKEMHTAGIIHRDIKTSNFLIKDSNTKDIKIGDFGISRYFDIEFGDTRLTTNTNEHTEGYSAPEAYSYLIGPEMDYYSLGITLWEVLTAKDPCIDLDGKQMTVEQIILNTVDGKMAGILLNRAPELSKKMRTLISGLLTKRHDKRWTFDLVTRFLDGEPVTVYEEPTQIGVFKIGNVECLTYKDIATQLLENKAAKDYVYKSQLNRDLVKINKELARKIADIVDYYSAKGKLDEGLAAIAYTLCPNLGFKLSSTISIESMDDIKKILINRPDVILPYLKDSSLGFYNYLDSLQTEGMTGFVKNVLIKKIVEESDSDYLIPVKISLALNGNKIRPFKDERYQDVILSNLQDLDKLDSIQRKRLIMLIDAGDRQIQAWLENHSGKNISDWKEFVGLCNKTENLKDDLWKYFSIFFNTQTEIPSVDLYDTVKELKDTGNYPIMNKLIDCLSYTLEKQNQNKMIISYYSMLRKNHLEGLSKPFDYYMGKLGKAYYDQGNLLDAEDYFELTLKLNPDFERSPEFLNYSYDISMKNYHFAESEKIAEKIVKLQPDSCWSYFKLAEALFLQDKFKEAIPYYTFAIEKEEHKEFFRRRKDCYKWIAPMVNGRVIPEYEKKIEYDDNKYRSLKK